MCSNLWMKLREIILKQLNPEDVFIRWYPIMYNQTSNPRLFLKACTYMCLQNVLVHVWSFYYTYAHYPFLNVTKKFDLKMKIARRKFSTIQGISFLITFSQDIKHVVHSLFIPFLNLHTYNTMNLQSNNGGNTKWNPSY